METAKVMSANGANPKPIHCDEAVDALLALDEQVTQQAPQQVAEPQELSRVRTATPSERTSERDQRKKPFSKILRITRPVTHAENVGIPAKPSGLRSPKRRGLRIHFATKPKTSAEQASPHNRNASKRSPQSRSRSSRDNRESRERLRARQMPRASSSQEGFPRTSSLKRTSLPRSSSERQYGAGAMRAANVSPRGNSRRWHGDDFRTPRPEEEEEGELDSFFRFMEDCTRAVWVVLRGIPAIISQLPEITMDILKQLIPALRGPTTPLIERPRGDENSP